MIPPPALLEMYMQARLAEIDEDVHGRKARSARRFNRRGLGHALVRPAGWLAAKLRHASPLPEGTTAEAGGSSGGALPMSH